MRAIPRTTRCAVMLTVLISSAFPGLLRGQDSPRLFPDRALLPALFAGPRDPVAKGEFVFVTDNPNAFGDGVEVELSLGIALPILRLAGHSTSDAVVLGVEGAAFARFGLQVIEREMIATDWYLPYPWSGIAAATGSASATITSAATSVTNMPVASTSRA